MVWIQENNSSPIRYDDKVKVATNALNNLLLDMRARSITRATHTHKIHLND